MGGLTVTAAAMVILSSFGSAYEISIHSELDRMGYQLMMVPLGCPYDASARVVKGQALDNTLPFSALERVRSDPAVALAAPLLITAVPRPEEQRVDLWVGLDEAGRSLKPWWKVKTGRDWFNSTNGVILGAEAASIEMRMPGDSFYCGEAKRSLKVEGILERSGMSDDNLLFVPLATAQSMFRQADQLTAIAIRLHDPALLRETATRLQEIPGAQVSTVTETAGVFLNIVGSVRVLLQCITVLAVAICSLGILNTMLAAVLEREGELAVMRAVGASNIQLFSIVSLESILMAMAAALAGILLAVGTGGFLEDWVRPLLPLAPTLRLWRFSGEAMLQIIVICGLAGFVAGAYPAWRASRIQPAIAVKTN